MTTITTNINKDENNNNTDQWMDLAIDTTEKKSNTTTLNAMEYLMQTLSKKDATIIINNLGATTMEDLKLVDNSFLSFRISNFSFRTRCNFFSFFRGMYCFFAFT